jgi:hypothetical protein
MIYAILAIATINLGGTVFLILQYLKEFKLTRAQVKSVNSEIKKMRQEPPRIRTPYEERLKAEYAKRGMKWEITGK